MSYIDGMIALAVPNGNKAEYLAHARKAAAIFREHGATKASRPGATTSRTAR